MRLSVVSVYEKSRLSRCFLYIVLMTMALVCLFVWINIKVTPFVISVAQGYATNAVSNTLNEILDEALKEEKYEFVNLLKDGEGKVSAVTMNSADTNLLITKITIGLKNRIADLEEIEAKIPLGNFLPYPFLAGIGPDVPVKFLILANSNVITEESFTAKGINQTLYTLSFHVDTKVGIYIPAMHSTVNVGNDIPIAQTLIIGGVPDSYTNVEGMDGTVQDTVLDVE